MPGLIQKAEITFEGPPLSHLPAEVIQTLTAETGEISTIVRDKLTTCCLGILGSDDSMNHTRDLVRHYPDFKIKLTKERQSIRLDLSNAPANAFIDGQITSLRKGHIAAAIRDMAYQALHFGNATTSKGRTGLVEKILDDAHLLEPKYVLARRQHVQLLQVVFQGGHTVGSADYSYSKRVGEELGLRGFEGISGGGPGTMRGTLKGNMKGFMQQKQVARQMGFTAPEIITAEPPNIYVSDLVILPDIEKRLEAFARKMHAIVFLPGGVGTLEELLIQLAIKMDEQNKNQILPIVMTATDNGVRNMSAINEFIGTIFGEEGVAQYKSILNSPKAVAEYIQSETPEIKYARDLNDDSYDWNRSLYIPDEFQETFIPTHENVEALELHWKQPVGQLAAELRKMCKAIVHGSVLSQGMQEIKEKGKYRIHGEREIIEAVEKLLRQYIAEGRMRSDAYEPCYILDTSTSVSVAADVPPPTKDIQSEK